jgi:hypothetical protein
MKYELAVGMGIRPMTEPEIIWRLAKDADAIRPEVYMAVVDYMGVEAFACNDWDTAEQLMAAHWLGQSL